MENWDVDIGLFNSEPMISGRSLRGPPLFVNIPSRFLIRDARYASMPLRPHLTGTEYSKRSVTRMQCTLVLVHARAAAFFFRACRPPEGTQHWKVPIESLLDRKRPKDSLQVATSRFYDEYSMNPFCSSSYYTVREETDYLCRHKSKRTELA